MTLTDEQVRALAEEVHDVEQTWEGHTFRFMFTGREPIRQHVRADAVKALATEVLASRGRRCGACVYWEAHPDLWAQDSDGNHLGNCGRGVDAESGCTRLRWSCADFTPKGVS
jgi:hypothetical protein